MKLVTFTHSGTTRIGALKDDRVVDLSAIDGTLPKDMVAFLQGGDDVMLKAREIVERDGASYALAEVKLESPVLNPPRILAVALNYLDHFYEIPEFIREARGMTPPEIPVIFNKQTTSINGPFDPVLLPPESSQMDYEAELAVVIGKTCRRVSKEQAFDVVAGYTVLNDVTIRDWQIASPTMTMGKSWDTHCPMGPALVTKDEVADPENLNVRLTVNGVERQNFNTKDMIINIADQIAHLSTAFTLKPGDAIATGTSAGVAMFAEGQPWLVDGDIVRVEIEGLGALENRVELDKTGSFIQ